MSTRSLFVWFAIIIAVGCSPNGNTEQSTAPMPSAPTADSAAAETAPENDAQQTLFTNVRVWDGNSEGLTDTTNVLVVNKLIHSIGPDVSGNAATVIDGGGRTLMPGLIDMHSHLALSATSMVALESSTWEALGARTALVAEETLMDGFTTVRDAGGMNGKGVKKMIDTGELVGPRIFPSGGLHRCDKQP